MHRTGCSLRRNRDTLVQWRSLFLAISTEFVLIFMHFFIALIYSKTSCNFTPDTV